MGGGTVMRPSRFVVLCLRSYSLLVRVSYRDTVREAMRRGAAAQDKTMGIRA